MPKLLCFTADDGPWGIDTIQRISVESHLKKALFLYGSMRSPVEATRCCGVGLRPKPWTLDIQPQPAEQFDRVIQAEAPALEQLEFVIESFDEAAGMPAIKIVEDPVLPVVQGVEKFIKAGDACGFDLLTPEPKPSLRGGAIRSAFEDSRQRGAQEVGADQGRGLFEQFDQLPLLGWGQGRPFPAQQRPQFGGGQGLVRRPTRVESAEFLFPQVVDGFPVLDGDVKSVHHEVGLGQGGSHCPGVTLPHVDADPPYRGFQVRADRLQKDLHRRLEPVRQYRQHMSAPLRVPRPNHGHILAVPLAQRHLVDPQGLQGGERAPVHRGRQAMVHDAFHRLDPQIKLPADIGHRAVDQPLQDLLLERRGVRAVGVVPGAALGRGRPALAERTAVALRPDLNEHLAPEDRQMPQPNRLVDPMKPVDLAATPVARRRLPGAFHLDQQRGIRQHPAGQHTNIRQIQGQGDGDRHRQQSSNRDTRSAFHNLAPDATPLHLVASTGDLIEPCFIVHLNLCFGDGNEKCEILTDCQKSQQGSHFLKLCTIKPVQS
jgi:hypothetical protein